MGGASPELCGMVLQMVIVHFQDFLMEIQVINDCYVNSWSIQWLNIVNEDAYISAISDGMLVGSVSVYGILKQLFLFGVMTLQLELLWCFYWF